MDNRKERLKYTIYIKSLGIYISLYWTDDAYHFCRELAFQGYEFVLIVHYGEFPPEYD